MKIRLIVPNCHRGTLPLVVYGRRIAEIAGGFTATQGMGGWTDNQSNLVVEPVTIFDVFTYENASADLFRGLARIIAQDLHQQCVYLEIDGQAEFIKP